MARTTRTRVIGTTRLLEPVGRGGMAEVFRGIQEPLQREVAVKVLLPEVTRQREASSRFRREAMALASLQHENIVAIYDLVEKNRQLFMIMEYVEGVDVADLVAGGKLPTDISLLLARGVCSALAHAHDHNLVHRDVKPSNVLVSRRGDVKLTDFGIARDLNLGDVTRTGLVLGTPSYIAPELLRGQRADHLTDIYAVGILLFQCLSGERPFRGETHPELFAAIAKGERPRLRSLVPDLPRGLERLVDRCLEIEPAKRWKRAPDLRWRLERELGRVLEETPQRRMVRFLLERGHVRADEVSLLESDPSPSTRRVPAGSSEEGSPTSPRGAGPAAAPRSVTARMLRGLLFGVGVAVLVVGVVFLVSWAVAPEATEELLGEIGRWIVGRAP